MLVSPRRSFASLISESLRLICRIWFSLNWLDLPEYFEDHMKEWMDEFAKFLSYENPSLEVDEVRLSEN